MVMEIESRVECKERVRGKSIKISGPLEGRVETYSSYWQINLSRELGEDRMRFTLQINQYQTKSTVCVSVGCFVLFCFLL